MRSSSDWVQGAQGKWVRAPVQQTRGLNHMHNSPAEAGLQGRCDDASSSSTTRSMLHADYQRMLAGRHQTESREGHARAEDRRDHHGHVEEEGGLQARHDHEVITCLVECDGDARSVNAERSRSTRQAGRNRRRASVRLLDDGHRLARRPEVPTSRLCPSGEPNEALAHRGPDSRMVPAFAREQYGFEVEQVANGTDDSDARSPLAPVDTFVDRRVHDCAHHGALTRQEANARRPAIRDDVRRGRLRLDVSPHSRACKGGKASKAARSRCPEREAFRCIQWGCNTVKRGLIAMK